MILSDIPLVSDGEHSPIVLRVRERLNVSGGDVLDAPLQQMLRGLQQLNNIPATGCIDSGTLRLLDLVYY